MSNLDKLYEWLRDKTFGFEGNTFSGIEVTEILTKIKQLQKKEPKTYTQEEYDKACSEAYQYGLNVKKQTKFYTEFKDSNQ